MLRYDDYYYGKSWIGEKSDFQLLNMSSSARMLSLGGLKKYNNKLNIMFVNQIFNYWVLILILKSILLLNYVQFTQLWMVS